MADKYNKNLTGVAVSDEIINRTSNNLLRLGHDTIIASSVVVRTAPAGGGTLLAIGTDYTLGGQDARLTTEAGTTINTTLAVVNGVYHNVNLYVTYSTIGDYCEAEDANVAQTLQNWALNGASATPTKIWNDQNDGNGGTQPAPKPNSTPGAIGSLVKCSSVFNAGYTLPSGGTYAYWIVEYTQAFIINNYYTGVAAGGTQVAPSGNGYAIYGTIWRIA